MRAISGLGKREGVGLSFSKDRMEWILNSLLNLKESEFKNEPSAGMKFGQRNRHFNSVGIYRTKLP